MLSSISEGDNVWDIGANIGLYTELFSEHVGKTGYVFAFEPSAENYEKLSGNVEHCGNVKVVPMALGAAEGQVVFEQGVDEIGATSRVVENAASQRDHMPLVDMKTADQCIAEGVASPPNVVKIDTEGFELDVLQGMSGCLSSDELRVICVEVHFKLLAERGMRNAPARIEALLENAGFRCHWSDSSHIIASRTR